MRIVKEKNKFKPVSFIFETKEEFDLMWDFIESYYRETDYHTKMLLINISNQLSSLESEE